MQFSNSGLVSFTQLSPNHSGPRNREIQRITLHCTAGRATVEGLGAIFARPERQASANYGIDEQGRIGMYVEECNRSWCSSSYENDVVSVTVECSSEAYEPFEMNPTVYARILDLCEDICRRNGKKRLLWIPDRDTALAYKVGPEELILTCHFWFTPLKSCPGTWLLSRLGDVAEKVTKRLNPPAEQETAVGPAPGDGNTPSEWSKEAFRWAVENGILRGDGSSFRLNNPITREEAICLLYRAIHPDEK